MSEKLFRTEALATGYGDIQVLWGVDLDVEAGEIVCLVGSNGAGKSTLLKCVSGLLPPTAGRILMKGADISHATPRIRSWTQESPRFRRGGGSFRP